MAFTSQDAINIAQNHGHVASIARYCVKRATNGAGNHPLDTASLAADVGRLPTPSGCTLNDLVLGLGRAMTDLAA